MSTPFQAGTYDAQIRAIVEDLNALLKNISVPVVLESLHDLAPSLLVVTLELILQDRLPIPQATRTAKDVESRVEAMSVFIDVLSDASGQDDEALQEMDPRMLAIGEWDELVTVAEALVAVGRAYGIVSESSSGTADDVSTSFQTHARPDVPRSQDDSVDPFWVPRQTERSVPSLRSPVKTQRSMRTSTRSSTLGSTSIVSDSPSSSSSSYRRSGPAETSFVTAPTVSSGSPLTSYRSDDRSYETGSSSRSRPGGSSSTSTKSVPRCIHEVEDPEDDISKSFDNSLSLAEGSLADSSMLPSRQKDTTKKTPVRYSGWIEPVDDEEEVRSFEARQRSRFSNLRSPRARPDYGGGLSNASGLTPKTPSTSTPGRLLTRHNSPSQHTLALMNERAKLLEELASLKAAKLR